MSNGLLIFASVISSVMTLIVLAAAAWGMDTSLPWGLGIYPYLIPALSLPAFFLLRISVSALSRTYWALSIANGFAWYFGDQIDRSVHGLKPNPDPDWWHIPGVFFNFFTILLVLISVLIQLAAFCKVKEKRLTESAPPSTNR